MPRKRYSLTAPDGLHLLLFHEILLSDQNTRITNFQFGVNLYHCLGTGKLKQKQGRQRQH